jgi:hypothetical protein
MTAAWVAIGVSLVSLILVGLAAPIAGYFIKTRDKKLNGVSLRTGQLEIANAKQEEQIKGLRRSVDEYRPEMGSQADI